MGIEKGWETRTSRNDIVYIERSHTSAWEGSRSSQTLYLREWDPDRQEHRPPEMVAFASSSSTYDHSSGEDVYSDATVENVVEKRGVLSWEIRHVHLREVVANDTHERQERVTRHRYDLRSKQHLDPRWVVRLWNRPRGLIGRAPRG